jgi:hypothetical protein
MQILHNWLEDGSSPSMFCGSDLFNKAGHHEHHGTEPGNPEGITDGLCGSRENVKHLDFSRCKTL